MYWLEGFCFFVVFVFLNLGPPPTPTITVTDVGLNTITISWTIPDYDPDNVCGSVMYKVTISGLDQINTTGTMFTFTGLTPNTNYTITITPYNSAGDGTPEIEVVMTLPTGKARPNYFSAPPFSSCR